MNEGEVRENTATARDLWQPAYDGDIPAPPVILQNLAASQRVAIGHQGAGMFDAETGQIAVRALTCKNADCVASRESDDPLVFQQRPSGMKINADGVVQPPPLAQLHRLVDKMACPACGSKDHVWPYDPPEVVVRRAELDEELIASRAARASAKRAGLPMPTNPRRPVTIMRDRTALLRLYLLPSDD
ncbi:MAG: hypothetical protein MI757_17225 [Pirellulales bacterium]|nr:hypothetical protein [Pirellulales bacterium]